MDIVKKFENKFCKKGGWNCYCCGPKDRKEKRLIRKRARRIAETMVRKEVWT